ncbi:phosphatidylinositol N-acetylglucosaminyltransferase subunit C [Prorops nasuta]|uniref:phosphatidylinositol N-acetylglucosaminyltransferase subunit C n=1 Tax=Prorops nasuta TaxID=863751 RepID=UPI0034CD0C60
MVEEIHWRKNLYDNYGVPDNYTDNTFLKQLQKNIKPNNVTLLEAITLAASISIKLDIVVLFVIIFISLNNECATPNFIFTLGVILTILGYLIYNFKVPNILEKWTKDIRTVLVFLVFGYVLSPVLKTLTESISTDTIYAMAIIMFFIHLIFGKYGCLEICLSDSLSITSSIFGSLMLASRLASALHAFSLLTISVECFVLLPFLLYQMKNKLIISFLLAIGTIYALSVVSKVLSYALIIVTIYVHFICPGWYVRCQKYKNNIYGPWDEAIITS